jgi:pimeloyl-ACP methyl ester carboxylesterase
MAIESTLRAPDGRTLSFAEMGSSSGQPVFYFHGTPGSRNDFDLPYNRPSLDGVDARVIGIDRPGFGGSSFQKRRRYADWPADVAHVADHLGIDRFAVLGYSAGGPYVAACAHALGGRLAFAGIVSGDGPAETPNFRRGMGTTDAIMSRLARRLPALARLAIAQASGQATKKPEKFSATFDKELSKSDLELHADPELRAGVREIFLESTRQGPAGIVEDYRVWGSPSGIAYEEIEAPVRIWHGDADEIVPLHHAEYVAGRLPRGELTVLPGAGHLHPPERWSEFLSAAVANA